MKNSGLNPSKDVRKIKTEMHNAGGTKTSITPHFSQRIGNTLIYLDEYIHESIKTRLYPKYFQLKYPVCKHKNITGHILYCIRYVASSYCTNC